ncbi:MAG: IS1 family transposase [archaeon]
MARWKKEASKYCKKVHDRYVRGIHSEFIQLDELWSYVLSKIKQQWIWTAIDVKSRLLIAFIVAPRKCE